MSKKYTVYMHENKENKKKYIGITCKRHERRWSNGDGYKRHPYFYSAIQKNGWDGFRHIILEQGLTEKNAKEKETHYIKIYGTNDREKGYNLTLGGDGRVGYSLSDETKEKIAAARRGVKVSEETRERLRQSHIGIEISAEQRKKMAEGNYKKVLCVTTGKVYQSLKDAAACVSINYSNITNCCRGRQQHAGRCTETGRLLKWAYYE